jgi:hypothetical protein
MLDLTSTQIVNIKDTKYEVYIGRPSKWGNPFRMRKEGDRAAVLEKYSVWITEGDGRHLLADLHELKGKTLGCYCKPKPCHGDILIELIKIHS